MENGIQKVNTLELEKEMFALKPLTDRLTLMRFATQQAPAQGLVAEFGVRTGTSLRYLADFFPGRRIFGFDSFEGLPEPWDKGPNIVVKGRMAAKEPVVPKNVILMKGWFNFTAPRWTEEHRNEKIAFLHIDSDLYSSARTVLFTLNPLITHNTIILFDELSAFENDGGVYTNWREGEWKALCEWLAAFNRRITFIGRDRKWRVALKIEN